MVFMVKQTNSWAFTITVVFISLVMSSSLVARSSLEEGKDVQTTAAANAINSCQAYVSGTSTLLLAIRERISHLGIEVIYTEALNLQSATNASAILLDDNWIQENEASVRQNVNALVLEGKLVIVIGDLSKYAFDGLVDKLSADPRKDVIRSYNKQIIGRDPNIIFAVNAIKVPTREQVAKGQAVGSMSLGGTIAQCRLENLANYVSELIHNYVTPP